MGRLARGLLVAFALSVPGGGQAAAQAAAEAPSGALERAWAVWAAVDWSAPWAKHGTSPKEASEVLGSLGGHLSRIALYGPDLGGAAALAGLLAGDGARIARVAAATGETVLVVVLATGETVLIVLQAAGTALVAVVEAADGGLEPLGRYAHALGETIQGIDARKALERLLTPPVRVRRFWAG